MELVKEIKHYTKIIMYFLLGMVACSFLFGLLSYFGVFSFRVVTIISWISILLFSFVSGISCGRKALKRGFLEGIKIGGIFLLILLFLNLIFFQTPFSIKRLLYYCLIFISSIAGAMFGINKKEMK